MMCPRHSPRYMNINDQTRLIVSGVFVRHFQCFPKPHMKAKEFIKYEIAMHATIYHMMNEQLLIMRMRIATSREKKHTISTYNMMSFYFVLRLHVAHRTEQRILFFCRIESRFSSRLFCFVSVCSFEMSIWRRTIWAMNNVPKKTFFRIDEEKP